MVFVALPEIFHSMKSRLAIIPISLLVFIILMSTSCKKDDTDYVKVEIEIIEDFMTERGLTIEPTASGLYFMDEEIGTGSYPVLLDTVEVYYTGLFLNGLKFDSRTTGDPYSFIVGVTSVIEGWHEGLQLMRENGESVLIIPSWLAYGTRGNGAIPGYTPLYFQIELLNIKPGPNH